MAYMPMVYSIVRGFHQKARLRGAATEDLVQEGALALIRAADEYDPGRDSTWGAIASWRVSWAVREAIRKSPAVPISIRDLKAGHRLERMEDLGEVNKLLMPEPDERVAETVASVRAALARLDPRARRVLLWRYGFESAPVRWASIARRMGYSRNWVHQLMRRGLAEMEDILG